MNPVHSQWFQVFPELVEKPVLFWTLVFPHFQQMLLCSTKFSQTKTISFYELTFILFKVYSKLPRWVPRVLLHPIYSHYKCNEHRKHINNASIERSINSFLFLLRHFISDIYIIYHSTCSVSVSVFFTPVESLSMTLIRPRSNFYAISNCVSFFVFSFLIWTSWTRGHGENKVRTGLYVCAYITGRKKKKLA